MTQRSPAEKINVFVFHFDLVGFVDEFVAHGQEALDRLRQFQRSARNAFPTGRENTYVVTLFDNVWSRVNVDDPGQPSLLLKTAGDVMRAAMNEGFTKFFGAITRGVHDFDPVDRMLTGRASFEDLSGQHIDVTSEPHIRAAYVDRWARNPLLPQNCVWVSSDVLDLRTLPAHAQFDDSDFKPFGEEFDIAGVPLSDGRKWPFMPSKFRAIRPDANVHEA